MFQLALPVIRTAAPFIVKGAVAGARVLIASMAVGYGVDRTFKAGADTQQRILVKQGAIPAPEPKTAGQKIKSEMLFFAKSALDTIGTCGLSCLVLGVAIAVTPVNPVLGTWLAIAAMGVLIVNVVAWMYRKDIAQAFRRAGRAMVRGVVGLWGRLRNAIHAMRLSRDEWTDIVEETTEQFETGKRKVAEPEVQPADGPDPEGRNVDDGINANFDAEADRDELTFQSRLTTLVGLLNEDDFRANANQAVTDFMDELPQNAIDLQVGYKSFALWVNKSRLSANQKNAVKKIYRNQILTRSARKAA